MPEIGMEMATRTRAGLYYQGYGMLPDPDPVLRKLGRDMRVYRDLLTDAHVFSCVQSRKSGTLSCEFEIRPGTKGGSTEANQRAADLVTEILDGMDVHSVIAEILDAPFFGMAPVEVVWERDNKTWFPRALTGRPVEWFGFDDDNRLRFKSVDAPVEGEFLPEYKFLLARHFPSYLNPYGERILSRCFWPVSFKRGGWRYWVQFAEKYGGAWAIGKMPPSASEPARQALLAALVALVQDGAGVINNDESVDLIEAAGKSASGQIYDGLISTSNREISKAILGQTLTTELDRGGSYAATKEHMEVRSDLVDADKRMTKSVFNRLCAWITELNVPNAAPPEFCFFEEEDIQSDRATRDGALVQQGVRFKPQYYQRVYNLDEKDFELSQPGQPGQPGRAPGDADSQGSQGSQYAEGDPDSPGPVLDKLGQMALDDSAGGIDDLMKPVEKLLKRSKTLEEFRDGLVDVYGDMDPAKLATVIQRAMALAEMSGRYDAVNR